MNPETLQASSRAARSAIVRAARGLRQRQTESERLLWNALRNRRLDGRKFRRQARIAHYVVDFHSAEEQLVVEIDGGVHAVLVKAERGRDEFLEDLGLRVLRVRSEDVEIDLPKVLDMIRSVFRLDPPKEGPRA